MSDPVWLLEVAILIAKRLVAGQFQRLDAALATTRVGGTRLNSAILGGRCVSLELARQRRGTPLQLKRNLPKTTAAVALKHDDGPFFRAQVMIVCHVIHFASCCCTCNWILS